VLRMLSRTTYSLITKRNYKQVFHAGRQRINASIWPNHVLNPVGASIGIIDKCNLKCIMCSRQDPNIQLGELTFEQFQGIIQQIPMIYSVMLTGHGEPLLHRDLFAMIEYLHSKKISAGVFSNATLLTPKTSETLLNLKLEDIRFSLDGATKETYEKIRVGARFDEVISNVSNFVNMSKKMGSKIRIGVRMTAMKDNLNELPAMVHLTSELGIRELQIANLSELLPQLEGKSLKGTDEETREVLNSVQQEARHLGTNLRIHGFIRHRIDNTRVACKQPYIGMRINATGEVNPCCGSTRNFGNVSQKPIKEIWSSPEFNNFRRQVKSKTPPAECLSCPVLEWE